jgi:hypothetical protein
MWLQKSSGNEEVWSFKETFTFDGCQRFFNDLQAIFDVQDLENRQLMLDFVRSLLQ